MMVVVSGVQREQGGSLRHRDNYGIGNPKFRKIVKIVNRGHSFVARERMPELSKTTVSLAENFVFGMHPEDCAESLGI
jgi:hypothetical protein